MNYRSQKAPRSDVNKSRDKSPGWECQRRVSLPKLEPRKRKEPAAQSEDHRKLLTADFELFRQFFEQFLALRVDRRSTESPPKKLWTPRSRDPVERIAPRVLTKSVFRRKRVHFACPACHRVTELPAEQAGQKARCPRCFSAIRVPHPGGKYSGHNLERDMEALIHPERFEILPHRGLALIRSRHLRQTAILCCLALAVVLVTVHGFRRVLRHREEPLSLFNPQEVGGVATEKDPGVAAEKVVRQFLAADGWREKIRYVRDPEHVADLMRSYYDNHSGSMPIAWRRLEATGTGYYADPELSHPVTQVQVETQDGLHLNFAVEHTPRGPLVEWETSIGYSPVDWNEILVSQQHALPVRVLAALDDYYNYDFQNQAGHLCIRLQDPQTNDLLGYGYLNRQAPEALTLENMLAGSSPDDPRPVMIEVKASERSQKTKQVHITKVLADGWRSANPVMAGVAL